MGHRVHQPAAALREFVRYYVSSEQQLGTHEFMLPVPARSASLIDFQLGDPCELILRGQERREIAPSVAVVGALSFHRALVVARGHSKGFAIFFQPSGLFRLFSIPHGVLTNNHFDGRAVIGRSIDELARCLGESRSAEEQVRHVDDYLLRRRPAVSSREDISEISGQLLRQRGCMRVSDLAARSGVSARQLERRFLAQIGLPPKIFARVVRFEAALRAKQRAPHLRWTDVAHDLGYHDQMHMVRDFHEFSDATPSSAADKLIVSVTDQIAGMSVT